MFGYLLFERDPVPQFGWGNIPEVVLQLTLRCRAAFIGFVRALYLCHLTAGFYGGMVNGLEDLLIKQARLGRVEGHA